MPTSGGYFKSLALAREEVQKEKRLEIMPEKKKAMSYRREGVVLMWEESGIVHT